MANNRNGQYRKYRKNNNYNNNRKDNRFNDNRINDNRMNQPVFKGFDATQYKKPDILIKDLNGKVYKISGNFSSAFTAEIMQMQKRIKEITESDPIEKFPEIFDILKTWCLKLINLNVDGEKYNTDDVDKGFNDVYVLYNLVAYISDIMSREKINEHIGQ